MCAHSFIVYVFIMWLFWLIELKCERRSTRGCVTKGLSIVLLGYSSAAFAVFHPGHQISTKSFYFAFYFFSKLSLFAIIFTITIVVFTISSSISCIGISRCIVIDSGDSIFCLARQSISMVISASCSSISKDSVSICRYGTKRMAETAKSSTATKKRATKPSNTIIVVLVPSLPFQLALHWSPIGPSGSSFA